MEKILKKSAVLFLAAFYLLTAFPALAQIQPLKNLGFLKSAIWFSKEPSFSGEKVRIYSTVFNSSSDDLVGIIDFYDNGGFIGKADFSVAGNGKIKEVWTDWAATEGKHIISAKITEAKTAPIGGNQQTISLENNYVENTIFVDVDTDKDNVGDQIDQDDDNDEIPDAEELKNGTNPLKRDTDRDGLDDKNDPSPLNPLIPQISQNQTAQTENKETQNSTTRIVERYVSNVLPAPVLEKIEPIINIIDNFRENQKEKLELKKEQIKKEGIDKSESLISFFDLKKLNEETLPGEKEKNNKITLKSVIDYLYYSAISIAAYVLNNKILFYALLALTLFQLLRLILRWIF